MDNLLFSSILNPSTERLELILKVPLRRVTLPCRCFDHFVALNNITEQSGEGGWQFKYYLLKYGCWFGELGTAAPYGCNDKIDSVGNLTSPRCSSVNVMRLFGSSQRRKRSWTSALQSS